MEVAEALAELTPGDHAKKSALFNSRRRGRRERRQDRPRVHQAPGGRRLRPRLPRPYQPHHGADREEHAVQARLRPVRARGLPRPGRLRLPLADRPRERRPRGRRPGHRPDHQAGRRRRTSPRSSSSRSSARAASSSRPRASCRRSASSPTDNGIVFVADEIQSGFCRTGQWFACEDEGIVPDLITTAKGIAGGLPLAAVTGRAEIMDAAHAGGLGGTYGGNPVACAGALGAIETMKELDLNARAKQHRGGHEGPPHRHGRRSSTSSATSAAAAR